MYSQLRVYFLMLFLYALIIIAFSPYKVNSQLVNDTKVNDDSTTSVQELGKVGTDANGNFIVVWHDYRSTPGGIYCQRFNSNGQRVGTNISIFPNSTYPQVAVRKNGSFGLLVIDTVPKFRLYNNLGTAISSIIVIDSIKGYEFVSHSISCDSSGNFVIVFGKYISPSNINIHYQMLDSIGNKIGGSTKVNDDVSITCRHTNPVVTKRWDGSFIIAWQDQRPPSIQNGDDIYFQMYDKNGTKIGNNTRVNDDTLLLDYQHLPQISSDNSGRFSIVFTQIEDNSGATYNLVQSYNANGTRSGNNIRFSSASASEQYPLISKRGNGDMVICFRRDASANYIPYIHRINSAGINIGSPFVVSSYYTSTEKITSSLALYDDKIITVWNDGRNGSQDVFFNIRSFTSPDSVISVRQISSVIPDDYKLFQNYPNPFNPITNFKFQVQSYSNVRILVYDITGKEIEKIIDGYQKPGVYSVRFDGSNLSSGIYFCTMFVDGKIYDSKKMILIK